MPAHFAMLVPVPSAVPAGQGDGPDPGSEALTARVAAGPGLWDDEDWLAELRRDGLIGELLASGAIGQAASEGGHAHLLDRALTAEMTMLWLVAGALFPGQGYDMVLARAFAMPGTRVRPGTPVPTGPALLQGRARGAGTASYAPGPQRRREPAMPSPPPQPSAGGLCRYTQ